MFKHFDTVKIFHKTAVFAVFFVLLAPATVSADGNQAPSLTGVDNETITICDSFDVMDGVSATDADGDTVTISVTGESALQDALTNDTPGTYTLTYTADDGNGGFDILDRDITVEDDGCAGGGNATPSLVGVSDTVTISICDSFDALSGVSATDADGDTVTIDFNDDDVQDALTNDTPGTYVVTYTADDGNGGFDVVDRTVVIEDGSCGTGGPSGGNTAPSLSGVSDVSITVCDSFDVMSGVSATDVDGDITTISVVGEAALQDALNNDVAGVYTLTYTADDGNGGFDVVDRDITVTDASCGGGGGPSGGGNTAPSLSGVGNVTISICDSFDVMDGVSATDADGDTVTISVTGESALQDALTNDTPGTYTLTYTADDGNGASDIANRTITVVDADCGGSSGGGGGNNGGGGGGCVNCGSDGGGSSTTAETVDEPTPQVLGATSCSYLNDYLHRDFNNNPIEVMKLQAFLNVFEGFNLEINGVFDQATFDAVKVFQVRHNDGVLNPWGYSDTGSTGYVYILTKKKINEIFCNTQISLTAGQAQEIDAYRNTPQPVVDTTIDLSPEVSVDDEGSDGDTGTPIVKGDSIDKGQQDSSLHVAAAGLYSGINSIVDFILSTCFLVFLFGILLGWLLTEWYKGQKESKGHMM